MDLYYRKNIENISDRYKEWFKQDGEIKYLVNVIPAEWNSYHYDLYIDPKTPKLLSEYNFDNRKELFEYLDFTVSDIKKYWDVKLDWNLDDDMIPTHTVKLGYAEQAAAIAGVDPVYSDIGQTSYLEPIIKSYNDFDPGAINFSKRSKWSLILKDGIEFLLKKAEGNFFVEARLDASNPSDLAFQFRGSDIYLDFYDNPEEVNKLLEVSCNEGIKFIEYFRTLMPKINGGYPLTWHGGSWTPDEVYAHNGDNVADQVSGDIFEKFLLQYHNRISGHFGGCVFGREARSKHLWDKIPMIEKIKAWAPRSMENIYELTGEVLENIAKVTEDLPFLLESKNMNRFNQYVDIVKKNGIKAFFIAHCRDREEAREVLKIVRKL